MTTKATVKPGDLVVLRCYLRNTEPSPSDPSYVGPFEVQTVDEFGDVVGQFLAPPLVSDHWRLCSQHVAFVRDVISRILTIPPEDVPVCDAPGRRVERFGSDAEKLRTETRRILEERRASSPLDLN